MAALGLLLTVKPRAALLAGFGGAILGLAALGLLEWKTHGGFIRHIIEYNVNPWTFEALALQLRRELRYVLLLAAAVGGLGVLWLDHFARGKRRNARANEAWFVVKTVSLWLFLSLAMLASLGKHGASVNYFIEPMCVCAIAVGMFVGLGWQAVVDDFWAAQDGPAIGPDRRDAGDGDRNGELSNALL